MYVVPTKVHIRYEAVGLAEEAALRESLEKGQGLPPLDPYIRWKKHALEINERYQAMSEEATEEKCLLGALITQMNMVGEVLFNTPLENSVASSTQSEIQLGPWGFSAKGEVPICLGALVYAQILLPTYEALHVLGRPQVPTTELKLKGDSTFAFHFELVSPQETDLLERFLLRAEARLRRQNLK